MRFVFRKYGAICCVQNPLIHTIVLTPAPVVFLISCVGWDQKQHLTTLRGATSLAYEPTTHIHRLIEGHGIRREAEKARIVTLFSMQLLDGVGGIICGQAWPVSLST